MLSRAWQASVPREILQSTPEQEVKRQEAIHELIYTEEDYARDLNLLDDVSQTRLSLFFFALPFLFFWF